MVSDQENIQQETKQKRNKDWKGTPRTVSEAQHARGAGGNPRPGADIIKNWYFIDAKIH